MKKYLAIFLTVSLLLLALGGCAKKKEESGDENGGEPETELAVKPEDTSDRASESLGETEQDRVTEAETETEPQSEAVAVEYGLWIGDVRVTDRNQADVLGDGTVVYEGDGSEGTLILRNAKIQTVKEFVEEMEDSTGICSKIPHLTLELWGESRIGGGTETPMAGFSAYDLTVTGDGSLVCSGGKFGLVADDVTVLSGTVIAMALECADASLNAGFAAFGSLSVLDGEISGFATMAIEGMSYGVLVFDRLYFEGGSIEAEHLRGADGFPAIYFSKIEYGAGYWPLIRAGVAMGSAKTVDDYTTYTYKDGYILIR